MSNGERLAEALRKWRRPKHSYEPVGVDEEDYRTMIEQRLNQLEQGQKNNRNLLLLAIIISNALLELIKLLRQ